MLGVRDRNQHRRIAWPPGIISCGAGKITNHRQCLFSESIVFDQADYKAREIDPARDQRSQTGEDR